MRPHFAEIGEVTDMVTDTVFVDILIDLGFAAEFFGQGEGLPNRAGVRAPASDVVDLAHARGRDEGINKGGDVVGMDVVPDLLALVTEDLVFASLEIAFHEVTQEAVELDAAVVWPGEAASAQAAGRQAEVATVLLHHDIGGDFGRSEEGVLGLVDGEVLGDSVDVGGIVIVPAGLELFQPDAVGSVAVDLVRRQVDEGRLGTGLAGRFEQVQGADGVGIKVVERDRGGAVMRGLRGGVNDGIGLEFLEEGKDSLAVPDIEFVMVKGGPERFGKPSLIPPGVSLWSKENGPLVVVETMDFPPESGEMDANFRADQAGGSGDEEFHF